MNHDFFPQALSFVLILLSIITIAFFFLNDTAAETHTVDDDGPADYSSIQAAIDDDTNVNPGDTLLVKEGTYEEQLTIDKQLRIFGDSADISKIIIDGEEEEEVDTVTFSISNIVFQNFTLKNSEENYALISVPSSTTSSNISNCRFEVVSFGIVFGTTSTQTQFHDVYNCTLSGNDRTGNGITITNADNLEIINCTLKNLETGIDFNPEGLPGTITNSDNTINDCIISGNSNGINFTEMGMDPQNENTGTDTQKNSIFNNVQNGISYFKENPDPIMTDKLDTTECWWGDESGPETDDNPDGKGDKITVEGGSPMMIECYQPWEQSPRRGPTTFYVDDDASDGWYSEDGHFKYIQDALNESFKNDAVRVYEGTYYQNLYMNRSHVDLIGNDSDDVTVDAGDVGNGVEINAEWCNLSGFTITGSESGSDHAGIKVSGDRSRVFECESSNNGGHGLWLFSADHNIIENASFTGNTGHGIYMIEYSEHNVITNVTCEDNNEGIDVQDSSYNFMGNITSTDNSGSGFRLDTSNHNTLENVTCSSNDGDYALYLRSSSYVTIDHAMVTSNAESGIYLWNSDDNVITNATLFGNKRGLAATGTSANNEIHYSCVSGNTDYGIEVSNGELLDAEFVYWGAADGPSGVGPGSGDAVSEDVDYTPFLRTNFTKFQILYRDKETGRENVEYKNVYTVWNPLGDDVSFTLTTDAGFLDFGDGNTTLYGTPSSADIGDYDVKVYAETDGGKKDWHNFTLQVIETNDPPVITTTPDTDVDQDEAYSVTYEADDEDEPDVNDLDWGWYNNDSAAFLHFENDGNLTLWGTPGNDDVGDYLVCIWVEDAENRTHAEFTLTVHNINDDPYITSSPDDPTTINEDEVYTFTCEGDDPDIQHGDSITWSMESDPTTDRITINPTTGELRAEFRTDDEVGGGLFDVTVTVQDNDEASDSAAFTFTVNTVNDLPVITSVSTQNRDEDEYYEITFTATDEEDDVLQWECDIDPDADFLTFRNSNQTLYGKPRNDDVGSYSVTIDIQEQDHNENTDSITFTLNVRNTNDPPSITPPSPAEDVDEESDYYYDFNATDDDLIHGGETLSWYLYGNASWLDIDRDTGELTGMPENDDVGWYDVSVKVEDDNLAEDFYDYILTVNNTNDPPSITIVSLINNTEVSGEVTIQGTSSDPDPDEGVTEIQYRINNETWESASGTTGWLLEWNTTLVEDGDYFIEFRAFDGEAYSGTRWIFLLVNNTIYIPEPVPNKKPLAEITGITPKPADFGVYVTFNASGSSDEDGHIVLYVWRSSLLGGELYNGNETVFELSTLPAGTHTIYLKVQDNASDWSQEVSTELIINPEVIEGEYPSDFNSGQNPTPISSGDGSQSSPSIYGNIMAWQDDRNSGWDIFMFDLENPDVVRQISSTSSEMGDSLEMHMQTNPIVYKRKIIWLHEWWDFTTHEYNVRIYDLDDPVPGGEVLFDIGSSPLSLDFSGNWVVWTDYADDATLFDLYFYGLNTYNIETGAQTKITNLATSEDYALSGDKLLYFRYPEDALEKNIILKIRTLTTGGTEKEIKFSGELSDLYYPTFWGDYIVWEDHRLDESGNTDIYFIDLNEGKIAQVTTETSAQKKPRVQGDYIIWEDSRGGKSSIYAYSITQNKQAELYSTGSNTDPILFGDGGLWVHKSTRSGSAIYYFDIGKFDNWVASESAFSTLDTGGGGNGEESSEPSYYSTSNVFFIVPVGVFLLGLVIAIAIIGRAKKVNGLIAFGLVLIILGALVGVALIPLFMDGAEEYDEWAKSEPDSGETMTVGAFIKEKEEILDGAGYQYYLEGSDVPFLSSEDVGDEGDFIIVDIQIDAMGIPEARSQSSPWVFVGGGAGLAVIGIILVVVGGKKIKASAGMGPKTDKASKKEEKKRLKEEKKKQKKGGGDSPGGTQQPGMGPGMPPQFPQQPMPPGAMPPQAPPQQQPPSSVPELPQAPGPSAGKWTCVKCNKEVDPKFSFCVFCGSAKKD